ncbi:hypothetical protein HN51_043227 [Arachis hypogaea]|uniref:Phytocyanin domain-containing protein n=1 Tax=Arachis hypogaea TaxID=3818 RepID=A0A444Y6Q4_ARAHY|nr:uclacyanin 1 [Arachis ipaensis]XP_025672891.1 uclacyanin 1 [Arachis hypogaea]RYQ97630.1 hypothetical protein Ahy_B08g093711 [Arachis hypogaea]
MGVLEIIVRVTLVTVLIKLVMATDHIVGGPNGGWDTSSDLQSWALSQKFSVGDKLIFQYPPNHNVIEVTKADYDSCQLTKPIQTYNDGKTTIPLTSPGKKYYICGTIGHCSTGMKVEIDTTLATAATSSASSSPVESPSPQEIPIIPSPGPEGVTLTPSPSAESPSYGVPLASSPLLDTPLETPTLSPMVPSTEFTGSAASPLENHSVDQPDSSSASKVMQAAVLSYLTMIVAF